MRISLEYFKSIFYSILNWLRNNAFFSLLTGVLLTLAFPLKFWSFSIPEYLQGYTAWIAYSPLIYSLHYQKTAKSSFYLFWLTGYIYFTCTIFWIVVAMYEYGHISFILSLLALSLLTSFLSLFHGSAGYISYTISMKYKISPAIVTALSITSIEFLRNYLFTGFPWSNLAYSQANFPLFIQIADITGIYGVCFLLVSTGGIFAEIFVKFYKKNHQIKQTAFSAIFVLAMILVTTVYGGYKLKTMSSLYDNNIIKKRIALLQGNIPQDEKWLVSLADKIVEIYSNQVKVALTKKSELVIWPEAAIPYLISAESKEMIESAFPNGKATAEHIIGVPTYIDKRSKDDRLYMYNSAFLVDSNAKIIGRYDKSHLVPFGEYVPLRSVLSFLGPLVQAVGDFLPGTNILPLHNGKNSYGIVICYEDIFPEISRKMGEGGMDLLVNITNDAWYGDTSASQQHLDMAIFRAIENRVFVARSANTGISAFIDPTGRIISKTELFKADVLVKDIPMKKASSLYIIIGDMFAISCLIITTIGFLSTKFVGNRKI